MSRSVHATRATFRKAFRFKYSTSEERARILGKIIDQKFLKRDLKENAKRKKQAKKESIKSATLVRALYGTASKKSPVSSFAKSIAAAHDKKGYG
jgi:hypothetical protein